MKNETTALQEAINALTKKRAIQEASLRTDVQEYLDGLTLSNLIKNTAEEIFESSELKSEILMQIISVGSGMLSKKVVVGDSENPLTALVGTLVQTTVSGMVSQNADAIQSTANNLLYQYLMSRKEKRN